MSNFKYLARFSQALFLWGGLAILASCSDNSEEVRGPVIQPNATEQYFSQPPIQSLQSQEYAGISSAADQAKMIEEEIRTHDLFIYPEVTLIARVKNPQKALRLVQQAGGRVDYDPNFGGGSRIPFIVITLPPRNLMDPGFIASLEMQNFELSHDAKSYHLEQPENGASVIRDMTIPLQDVKLPQLRARQPGKGLGEDTIIAVIDTGVDASHPAFGNRVIYWSDATQELRTPLKEIPVTNGKILLEETSLDLPAFINKSEKIFLGKVNESAFATQLSSAEREAKKGVDINRNNNADDQFSVIVAKHQETGRYIALFETSATGKFSERDWNNPIADFNESRSGACRKGLPPKSSLSDMVKFPSRARLIAFPVLIEKDKEGNPLFLALGADLEGHGTHVAGIAAGNGGGINGAAPEAKIISLKVCSGISCTGSAMARGILEAFYNDSGCVPDVVNISIGGPQGYDERVLDLLIRDLSAKFGTTFFVSAGNRGPGYRTQNNIGAFGPTVMVAAHVSDEMLVKLYQGNVNEGLAKNGLFSFSSPGPSYNGTLRPNIAAPGAALSSTPLIDGGSAMLNGTSMSAPLATGAAAAMLSLAKTKNEFMSFRDRREAKITDLLSGKDTESKNGSLSALVYAMRNSLEEGAQDLTNYTTAQQGYGLIDINRSLDIFLQKLRGLQEDKFIYGELDINKNSKESRLFERSIDITRVKPLSFTLREDGEADDAYHLRLRNSELEASLEQYEVQSYDGSVEKTIITTENAVNAPFAIVIPGQKDQSSGTRASLVLNNDLTNHFYSLRKMEMMEPGKTYVARYAIRLKGERIHTLADVVQMPWEFSEKRIPVETGTTGPNAGTRKSAFLVKDKKIGVNQIHRYPIAVTKRDMGIRMTFGISSEETGTLIVQVYDPDSKLVNRSVVSRTTVSSISGTKAALSVRLGKTIPGVYEVTVSASSGRWTSRSKYDLLIEASRLQLSEEEVVLATKTSPAGKNFAREKTVSFVTDPEQLSLDPDGNNINLTLGTPELFERALVKVAAQNWTFRRVNMPSLESAREKKSAKLTIAVSPNNESSKRFEYIGRIDNRLFQLSSDGKSFIPVITASAADSIETKRVFADVPIQNQQPLFYGLETFYYMAPPAEATGILIDTVWSISPPGSLPSESGLNLKDQIRHKENGVSIITLEAPQDLPTLPRSESPMLRLRSSLTISHSLLSPVEIPIYLMH